MLFAAGRNGHMPRIMTMLHKKYHSPWPATWTMGVVATVMLSTGSILRLISAISLFAGIMTFSLMMCLFLLRWRQPNTHRPIKIPIVIPMVVALICLTILIISVMAEPEALIINLIIIALGVPVYLLCFKCKAVQKRLVFMDRVGTILQHLFLLQYET
ncbi:large neutral amino acids transporter small subunit 2 [Plakobranchus ocellatus]|uniref:Large neutral amino acids transporter small subunit 2 n=1 Tax=Plakobranchus ocellatus TaxID=259542 RepID=A0AAV4BY39_9GAST|nr:large neutral amino acids transporter small subunit 2 [Plakobranchus ocellatus]